MKRLWLGLLCLLVLAFSGCAAVNQTNRFAALPEETLQSAPDPTVIPDVTAEPSVTRPPQVQLVAEPTPAPIVTTVPAPAPGNTGTPAPTGTPTQTPESSPGGFNG
ncbi:MAG: hypothetical protein IH607_08720 [Firmicutes bacterium]|nr:hypothetical protein [Bacillota bacterium]